MEQTVGCALRHTWQRVYGFDFEPVDRTLPCVCCGGVHRSNQYQLTPLTDTAFALRNHSDSCHTCVFDWAEDKVIKELCASPCSDSAHVRLLQQRQAMQGRKLGYTTAERFMLFTGLVWLEVHEKYIMDQVCRIGQRLPFV